jgi:hypothetical protein
VPPILIRWLSSCQLDQVLADCSVWVDLIAGHDAASHHSRARLRKCIFFCRPGGRSSCDHASTGVLSRRLSRTLVEARPAGARPSKCIISKCIIIWCYRGRSSPCSDEETFEFVPYETILCSPRGSCWYFSEILLEPKMVVSNNFCPTLIVWAGDSSSSILNP